MRYQYSSRAIRPDNFSAGTMDMPWWAGKESTREYLRKINEKGKVTHVYKTVIPS